MNSPQPETNITSNVVFSLMFIVASIQASGLGGRYIVAGIAATAMMMLSFDAAAASLLLKRRLAHSPKFYMGEG